MTEREPEMKFFDFIVQLGEKNWERNQNYYKGIASYYKQILSTDNEKTGAKKSESANSYKASSVICSADAVSIHPGSN
jgi:hypothetical protein